MRPFDPSYHRQRLAKTFVPSADLRLEVEIGCGVGLHPIRYSGEDLSCQLVAIEHTAEKFARFATRMASHQRSNLVPVHNNAISWISANLEPGTVNRYWLLYPNPNPKPKQANQRWHNMPFFGFLIETLAPEGEIILATNEAWYAEEAIESARSNWGLDIASHVTFDRNLLQKRSEQEKLGFRCSLPRTHFEKKYLERGQTCYQVVLRKAALSSSKSALASSGVDQAPLR